MTERVPLYPLLLQATLHVKVWGGRRLATVFDKPLITDHPYGESWELHDTSNVVNGPLAGRTLAAVLDSYGHDLLGPRNNPVEGFPLLAKFIDAADWLSIQVHPNDDQARQFEGDPRGKTEAWYMLATEPGARLVIAVKPGTTRSQMADAIRTNTLEDLVVYADVAPGDVLFIPAGTIHAIGPGVLLYEIQQSSNVTYRLYDWGRMDLNGKPRELHIDKGVSVANVATVPEIRHTANDDSACVEIVSSPYFETILHQLDSDPALLDTGGHAFHALTCIMGTAQVTVKDSEPIIMCKGQTILVPACVGAYALHGPGRVLRSYQP